MGFILGYSFPFAAQSGQNSGTYILKFGFWNLIHTRAAHVICDSNYRKQDKQHISLSSSASLTDAILPKPQASRSQSYVELFSCAPVLPLQWRLRSSAQQMSPTSVGKNSQLCRLLPFQLVNQQNPRLRGLERSLDQWWLCWSYSSRCLRFQQDLDKPRSTPKLFPPKRHLSPPPDPNLS